MKPEITQRVALADFFNASVDYLLGRTSERRTAGAFAGAQVCAHAGFLLIHTISMNGQAPSTEDKRCLCDVAAGMFRLRLQERRRQRLPSSQAKGPPRDCGAGLLLRLGTGRPRGLSRRNPRRSSRS